MIVSYCKILQMLRLNNPPSPAQMLERLTFAGFEGEGLTSVRELCKGVVAAKIVSMEALPGKQVRRVDLDAGAGLVQVATGDASVQVGETIAYAAPGVVVGGVKIEPRSVAGIASAGMLVSRAELGVGGDDSGAWRVAAKPGAAVADLLDDDWLLELNVTPNRGDALSHLGVAREMAALLGGQLTLPPLASLPQKANAGRIALQDEGCPAYLGVWLKIKSKPKATPPEIEALLGRCGMRSISPLVDLTNYVMLELGQPMHAFDADKINGNVLVRAAKAGETIKTLDGQNRKLQSGQLLIADANGPIAVAGVMGGANSEVDENSLEILLESAHFLPTRVSRSRRQLGISSEASIRFERGVDPSGLSRAAARWLALLGQLCDYEIVAIDNVGAAPTPRQVAWDSERAERLLGALPGNEKIEAIFNGLGFVDAGSSAKRQVPPWRFDVAESFDLTEEVARVWGYEHFLPTLPMAQVSGRREQGQFGGREQLLNFALQAGFEQAIHLSFEASQDTMAVLLQNPLGEQTRALRTSLWGNMLAATTLNHRRQNGDVRLVELGKVFWRDAADASNAEVFEGWRLGLMASGQRWPQRWQDQTTVGFHDLAAVIDGMLRQLGLSGAVWRPAKNPATHLHPGKTGELFWQNQSLGYIGEIEAAAAEKLGLMHATVYGEFDVDKLLAAASNASPKFADLPKFPQSSRDLAFVLPRATLAADVIATLRGAAGALVEDAYVFDVYEGPGIAAAHKSVAFRLHFRHAERTLEQGEIDAACARAISAVAERHRGQLRA